MAKKYSADNATTRKGKNKAGNNAQNNASDCGKNATDCSNNASDCGKNNAAYPNDKIL